MFQVLMMILFLSNTYYSLYTLCRLKEMGPTQPRTTHHAHEAKTQTMMVGSSLLSFLLFFFVTTTTLVQCFNTRPPNLKEPVVLTDEDYDEKCDGKTVLLMFYSSKCEDCKKYAPVWDVLANEFANNPIALIGAVNCLNPKSRNLCVREGINKMPSVKYGE